MTDANKTSTSHGRRLSIYAKCLSIAALATIVVTLALSINSYRMNVQLVKEGVTELGMAINRETASALGGAVRFNNVAEVNSRLEVMFINDIGYLSHAVVVNTAGEILADQSSDASVLAPAQMAAATAVAQGTSDSTSFGDMGAVHPITVGADNTVVGAVATQWQADQRIGVVTTNMLNGLLAALVLFFALLVASGWMLKRLVGTPLRLLENDVDAVAKGDYAREISGTARMDEIGNLSRSLSEMTNGLAEARRVAEDKLKGQAAEQMVMSALRDGLQTLAAGNLTARIDQEFPKNFNQLRDDFNATAATLGQTISAVVNCTTNIDRGSQDIGRQSEELSQRTENQAATLEETAAAIDQLTNLVKKVADDARTVEDSVKQTQSQAQESGQVVREAVQAMSAIEESSGKISTIISVIDDIAFQTNLLALNAGVEAARAGEAGRGFAVVASEVRALAQRSSDAAREIKGLIDNSSEQVGRGVDLVGRTGEALTGISERVTETTELIIQMASGAAEQSVSLGEINISVNDLDQNTQKNASMVDLANTTSRSLQQQSTDLAQIVSGFQLSTQRAQSSAA